MSIRLFDIPKRKKDRGPVASSRSNEKVLEDDHIAVLEEVLDELTAMSDDDLLEALVSRESDSSTAANSIAAEDASGSSCKSDMDPEVSGMIDDLLMDSVVNEAFDALDDTDMQAIRESVSDAVSQRPEDRIAPKAESSVSGIVKDDTILSLMHWGLINMSQVFEATKRRSGEESLWRVVAGIDGVDCEKVFAAVAQLQGYARYPYLDAAPTREFIEELLIMLPEERLIGLLNAGILPVDMEPEKELGQYRLILVAADPTAGSVQAELSRFGQPFEIQYAPREEVEGRIVEVRQWAGGDARFGLPNVDGVETDTTPDTDSTPDTEEEYGDFNDALSFEHPETLAGVGEAEDVSVPKIVLDGEVDLEIADLLELQLAGGIETDPASDPADSSAGAGPDESDTAVTDVVDGYDVKKDEEPLKSADEKRVETLISRDRVVRSLSRSETVSDEIIRRASEKHLLAGRTDALWRTIADENGVDRETVYEEAARVYAFNIEELSPGRPDFDFVRLTMNTIADEHREEMLEMLVVPFEHALDFETGSGRMIFVTPDPTRPEVNRLLHGLDLGRFELRYASESSITELLEELFPRKNEFLERIEDDTMAFDLGTSYDESEDELLDEDALEAEISRSKLINLFEASLVEATRLDVSDIHIFPNPQRQVEIHFRQDGRLRKWHTEDKVHPEAFLSVVKDNSTNVDRFERDSAQDGFIQRQIDDALIRFRVSILPIASANQELRAESIVIRVLDDRKVLTDLKKLGMLDVALDRFDQAIRQPHGMVILTGPTGSGKSTTLVAALYQVVTPEVNVLTVEDPVEYIIKGVRQIKLSHKLDLEGALRAILRHDPDIVMVGEMRDKHTAELAIKLANTGHLTFSTLHTNDAPAAVSRLYKMGVEPFLIAYAINLVVAQRLIRGVCKDCKVVDDEPDRVLMKSLGWTDEGIDAATIYKANRGSACPTCNGAGYKGRRAICETLYFSDKIRHMIASSGEAINEDAIRNQAISEGMLTVMDSARVLVEMGETTVEEMLRVTGAE